MFHGQAAIDDFRWSHGAVETWYEVCFIESQILVPKKMSRLTIKGIAVNRWLTLKLSQVIIAVRGLRRYIISHSIIIFLDVIQFKSVIVRIKILSLWPSNLTWRGGWKGSLIKIVEINIRRGWCFILVVSWEISNFVIQISLSFVIDLIEVYSFNRDA